MLHESAKKVETYLRERHIPYVVVSEAKRALFGCDCSIPSFDFVIYREEGPNLLAFAGGVTARRQSVLREWEKVFGRDFIGAFAVPLASGGCRFVGLDGHDLEAATLFAADGSEA